MEELDKLLPSVRDGQSDIAIGSRALKESQILVHQPLYREPLGFLYNDIIQLLVLKGIQDTQCGFKLFRRDVARDVFPRGRLSGFAFDVEILFIARKFPSDGKMTRIPKSKYCDTVSTCWQTCSESAGMTGRDYIIRIHIQKCRGLIFRGQV